MIKEYIIPSITEDQVTLKEVHTGKEETIPMSELHAFSQGKLIMGYNKVTGKLRVTDISDYLNYRDAQDKITNTITLIRNDNGELLAITKDIVEGDTIRVVIDEQSILYFTSGLCIIHEVESPIPLSKVKHVIYDIATDEYNIKYVDVVQIGYFNDIFPKDVTFTDRCTFDTIESSNSMFRDIPFAETTTDLSKFTFKNATKMNAFLEDRYICGGFINTIGTRAICAEIMASKGDIILPKLSKSIQLTDTPFMSSFLTYNMLEYLRDRIIDRGIELENSFYFSALLSPDKPIEYLQLVKDVTELISEHFYVGIDTLVIPLVKEVVENGEILAPLVKHFSDIPDDTGIVFVAKEYATELDCNRRLNRCTIELKDYIDTEGRPCVEITIADMSDMTDNMPKVLYCMFKLSCTAIVIGDTRTLNATISLLGNLKKRNIVAKGMLYDTNAIVVRTDLIQLGYKVI